MRVLLFNSGKVGTGARLLEVIEAQLPRDRIEIYSTIQDLARRLCDPRNEPLILVILASRRHELLNLLLVRDAFCDIPIILILPDREPDTISKGHRLYPRYTSYKDGDLSDVGMVLGKMIANADLKRRREEVGAAYIQ